MTGGKPARLAYSSLSRGLSVRERRIWPWLSFFVLVAIVALMSKSTLQLDSGRVRRLDHLPSGSNSTRDMSIGLTEPDPIHPGKRIRPIDPSRGEKANEAKDLREGPYLRQAPQMDDQEQRLWRERNGQVPPPSDDELLERALAKLKNGNLAYNTPEKMKTGQTAHVVARIGSDKVSISTLMSGMPTDKETKTATATTPVSTKMKVVLKSADFDITPLSSEEQFVAGNTPTTWEWEIVPKHSGKQLRLHLAAVVELNNLSRDFTTVDRDIAVQVDPVGEAEKFAKDNAPWILGGIGTGLTAGWAWFRRRKKSEPPKAPDWETP